MRDAFRIARATAVVIVLLASGVAFGATVSAPRFTPVELREDFTLFRRAYEEGHPGLYRFTPKSEMDRVFTDTEKGIDRPMDAWEFYRLLAPVVASIHCGHSRVDLPETLQTELTTTRQLLPMVVRVLDGRAWVYRDLVSPDRRLEGAELISLNGVSTKQILDTLYAAMPSDGFGESLQPAVLQSFRFGGMLERVFGFDGSYDVQLIDAPTAKLVRMRLAGATVPELQATLEKRYPSDVAPEKNGEFELIDGGDIARLKLRGFGGSADDSAKLDVRTFFDRSFATMRDRGTKSLILDLRDNGGGEDALGKILLAYLVDRPFDYYDDLVINNLAFSFASYTSDFDSIPAEVVQKRPDGKYHCVGHPNWGTQQPMEPHFGGRVFALMNGASFSTTCEFLSHLRDLDRATFIGEESGGAYVGNTSGWTATVVLPHTRVRARVPLMRYDLAVKPAQPFGHGIMPDVRVVHTIADLLQGKDKDLEKALALARATSSKD